MYFSKTPDCLASSAAAGKFQGEKGEAAGRRRREAGKEDFDGWRGGGNMIVQMKEKFSCLDSNRADQ